MRTCLLYTSDAADDTPCVDLGGRRIIKKKENDTKKNEYSNQISKKNPSYINVLKIINNYFNN